MPGSLVSFFFDLKHIPFFRRRTLQACSSDHTKSLGCWMVKNLPCVHGRLLPRHAFPLCEKRWKSHSEYLSLAVRSPDPWSWSSIFMSCLRKNNLLLCMWWLWHSEYFVNWFSFYGQIQGYLVWNLRPCSLPACSPEHIWLTCSL